MLYVFDVQRAQVPWYVQIPALDVALHDESNDSIPNHPAAFVPHGVPICERDCFLSAIGILDE